VKAETENPLADISLSSHKPACGNSTSPTSLGPFAYKTYLTAASIIRLLPWSLVRTSPSCLAKVSSLSVHSGVQLQVSLLLCSLQSN